MCYYFFDWAAGIQGDEEPRPRGFESQQQEVRNLKRGNVKRQRYSRRLPATQATCLPWRTECHVLTLSLLRRRNTIVAMFSYAIYLYSQYALLSISFEGTLVAPEVLLYAAKRAFATSMILLVRANSERFLLFALATMRSSRISCTDRDRCNGCRCCCWRLQLSSYGRVA